uniref:NADH dehydrogenase subunit 5 n=1 Tax=Marmessoidea bispina TaxID=2878957 RepID=UPI0025A94739|nr:NADH dehydrogenase subunit 5 [Marmessoidea bispina]WID87075.1 NADH dehydrogenase subunit 5 [Marmessoidea bispina]
MLWYYSLCSILMIYIFMFSISFMFLGVCFMLNDVVYFIEYELLMFNSLQLIMTLLFDWMSLMFMSLVLFISSLIIYYSYEYMAGDLFIDRFIILVLMFIISMMLMIVSPNLISILLGWDGLGLVSYCLVIYYQNVKSFNAGMITALSNRIGDSMLLISIAWMFSYGSWNYFMYVDFFLGGADVALISLFIVIAAMTKSAQIPFSSWLPAAMAAPTPVSSLVHSSTLVTAGVYLLIRFNPLYANSLLSEFLMIISLMTMFSSGFCANFEYDLKKIVALSTLSQLGLMVAILSFGYIYFAYFHMLTHAMFKALLFMCSGVIIHSSKDCQDIRFFGNLFIQMPLTCVCFMVASFCLSGIPFLSGFYSKDLILEIYSMSNFNLISYLLFYFSTGLTVSYSIRLIYYLLVKDFSFCSYHSIYDDNWFMLKSMFVMVIISIFGGSLLSWVLFPTPTFIFIPFAMKMMVIVVCLFGVWVGYMLNKFNLCDFYMIMSLMEFVYFLVMYGLCLLLVLNYLIFLLSLDFYLLGVRILVDLNYWEAKVYLMYLVIIQKWIKTFKMMFLIYFLLLFQFDLFL